MSGVGGSFSQSSSRSRTKDITPEEFAALRPEIANLFQSFFSGGQGFSGPFAAPLGAGELSALQAVQQGASAGTSPDFGLAQDALRRTAGGEFLSPESNPFLRQTILAAQRPVLEAFDEQELLDRSLFTRAGQQIQESSPFSRARGIATRGLVNELGDISTRIAGENFQAERGRQLAAASGLAQLDQAQFSRQVENLRAQALPRLVEDLGIERGIQEFQRRIDVLSQILALATGASSQFGQFSSGDSMSIGTSFA